MEFNPVIYIQNILDKCIANFYSLPTVYHLTIYIQWGPKVRDHI